MAEVDRNTFAAYQVAVYRLLRRYSAVRECQDQAFLADLARTELPRHLRHWLPVLQQHEPDERGYCRTCSRWWRRVEAPCQTWKWFHAFLVVKPARVEVPPDPKF